jgi:hypothetical protein
LKRGGIEGIGDIYSGKKGRGRRSRVLLVLTSIEGEKGGRGGGDWLLLLLLLLF